jgi:anti-sigma factor RsiW
MSELDQRWANLQIEAMADGSLSPDAARRMRALMERDPGLAQQLAEAQALRRKLRRLSNTPVPRGLARRLWGIPATGRRQSVVWMPAIAVAGIASLAVALGLMLYRPGPSPEELARNAAVQDFAIAVAYLQKSVLLARNEVNETVGSEMMDALAMSRGAIQRADESNEEGAQNDRD